MRVPSSPLRAQNRRARSAMISSTVRLALTCADVFALISANGFYSMAEATICEASFSSRSRPAV